MRAIGAKRKDIILIFIYIIIIKMNIRKLELNDFNKDYVLLLNQLSPVQIILLLYSIT